MDFSVFFSILFHLLTFYGHSLTFTFTAALKLEFQTVYGDCCFLYKSFFVCFWKRFRFPLETQANKKFELTIGRFADGHLHLFGQFLLLMNISCKLNSKCNFTYNETMEFQEMHGNRLRCCKISTFY